jgi:hypothetical protein
MLLIVSYAGPEIPKASRRIKKHRGQPVFLDFVGDETAAYRDNRKP